MSANELRCPKCGAANPAGSIYCNGCGGSLSAPPPQQPPFQPPPGPQYPPGGQYPPGMQPPYQQQGPYSYPPPQRSSNKGLISLICGIAGFILCGPLSSIPGMILGKMEMDAIRDGRSPQSGLGLAKAGFWVSVAATVVSVGLCLLFGLMGILTPAAWRF